MLRFSITDSFVDFCESIWDSLLLYFNDGNNTMSTLNFIQDLGLVISEVKQKDIYDVRHLWRTVVENCTVLFFLYQVQFSVFSSRPPYCIYNVDIFLLNLASDRESQHKSLSIISIPYWRNVIIIDSLVITNNLGIV